MKPGVYDGIPNAEYHNGPGVSNSGLSLVRRSPLHYLAKTLAARDNKAVSVSTPAQFIGTAFHALLLEPEMFIRDYTLGLRQSDFPDAVDGQAKLVEMIQELNKTRLPKLATSGSKEELAARLIEADPQNFTAANMAGATGADMKCDIAELNKARTGLLSTTGTIPVLAQLLRDNGVPLTLWSDIKAEWMRNNGHRIVLEPEMWDQLHSMRAAVMAHPAASRLMAMRGKAEQSVYWRDPATGVLCRIRPDWWPRPYMVDLKTCDDASELGFAKSISNYGYEVQEAFYCDGAAEAGYPVKAFLFLAVEKSARVVNGQALGVAVYQLDEASRELGRAIYRQDLAKYAECMKTGEWPCYGTQVQTIRVSNWKFNQNQHLIDQA